MNPAALNRVTIIAAAQLTDETATARPQVMEEDGRRNARSISASCSATVSPDPC